MTYLLPPLNALRAFEAAARHGSFARAAAELHVTPGAIGQQVRALERRLGVALFVRADGRLNLSAAGLALLPVLGRAFATITAALQDLQPGPAAVVRLGVRSGLSVAVRGGLARSIDRFRASVGGRQGIVVRIWHPAGLEALAEGKIDIAIDRVAGAPGGYRRDPLATDWARHDDCLVVPEGRADCPEIAALRAWLLAPAAGPADQAGRFE